MNIFGFRPFKGKFNLGNSDDIPTNNDGTLIGAIKQINTHLPDELSIAGTKLSLKANDEVISSVTLPGGPTVLTKTITKTADSLGCFNLDITSKAAILLVADTAEAYTYYTPYWYANANTMAVRGIRFSDGQPSTGSHTVKVWYFSV